MATPAEPVPSAIFRALRSVDVDPDLAYEAAEESRRQAGENVIAALGAKIDSQVAELKAEIDAQGAELKAEIKAQGARTDVQISKVNTALDALSARTDAQITEVKAEIKAQGSLIENLRQVVWRVIWPLIALLAVPIFGLLYEALAR